MPYFLQFIIVIWRKNCNIFDVTTVKCILLSNLWYISNFFLTFSTVKSCQFDFENVKSWNLFDLQFVRSCQFNSKSVKNRSFFDSKKYKKSYFLANKCKKLQSFSGKICKKSLKLLLDYDVFIFRTSFKYKKSWYLNQLL